LARKEQRNNKASKTQRNVVKEKGWWWLDLMFVGQDPTTGLFIGSLDLTPIPSSPPWSPCPILQNLL